MAGIDIISDSTGKEIVAAIQSTDVAQARILEINTAAEAKKNEVLENIQASVRSEVANEVAEISGRLDNIIAHNQDTEGNSELIDLRTDINGVTHESAGSAVRSQVNELKEDISNLDDYQEVSGEIVDNFYINVFGDATPHNNYNYKIINANDLYYNKAYVTSMSNSAATTAVYFSGYPSRNNFIDYEHADYPSDYNFLYNDRYELNIPSGTKYIAINSNKSMIIKVETKSTENIKDLISTLNSNSHFNKNFLMLGDSITNLGTGETGWIKYFNEIVKPKRVDNVAVDGCHWCDYNSTTVYNGNPQPTGDEQNVIGNQIQKIINNRSDYLDDYDYIFIACGTNDETSNGILTDELVNQAYFDGSNIKSLGDVDRSQWAGCTRYAIEKLKELFPNAKIIFNTPINRIDLHSVTRVNNNAKMIRQCAAVGSVMLCDAMRCGITMFDASCFVDNLHPSVKGAKKLGYYIANWFISNCNY